MDPFANTESLLECAPQSYQTQGARDLKDLHTNFYQTLFEDCWVDKMGLIPRHSSPAKREKDLRCKKSDSTMVTPEGYGQGTNSNLELPAIWPYVQGWGICPLHLCILSSLSQPEWLLIIGTWDLSLARVPFPLTVGPIWLYIHTYMAWKGFTSCQCGGEK